MPISYVGAGTAVVRNGNGTLTPTLPAGLQTGDLMLIYASARGNGALSVTTGGWSEQWQLAHASSGINKIALFYKFYASGDGDPVVSYAGGATGHTVLAQVVAFRGVDQTAPFDVQGATSSNASQTSIGPVSGITTGSKGKCVLVFGHRADDWTSVATLTGDGLSWVEIIEWDSTTGNDAGEVCDYALCNGATAITAKTFTVTGGLANTGMGVMQSLNEAVIPNVFGKTTKGSNSDDIDGTKWGCQFTAPENGILTAIRVYLLNYDLGTQVACVYSDNNNTPNALLASITRGDIPVTEGWYEFAGFNLPITAGTKYWLALCAGAYTRTWYDSVACRARRQPLYENYPPPSNPFGAGTDYTDREYSIYATYTTLITGWRKLQYFSEPPTIGAFNKLRFASEPPVAGAFNKILYEGE